MRIATSLVLLAALAGCSTVPPAPTQVPYIDAHSHIIDGLPPAQEVALFRDAGLAGVWFMHPEASVLSAMAAGNRGYIIPFVSLARLPTMPGLRLDAASADAMDALVASGQACGMGEIPTRIMPRTEASDDLALLNADRLRIYARANARAVPLNMHIDIANPAIAASVDRIARENPGAAVILAHAGWSAAPDVIARLMAQHSNVYADLSVRLDPAGGLESGPPPPGAMPPGAGNVISIIQADGMIQPAWRALIERFPDRFLFALDLSTGERPKHAAELLAIGRKALGALGPRVENAVAHGNAQRLMRGCANPARRSFHQTANPRSSNAE